MTSATRGAATRASRSGRRSSRASPSCTTSASEELGAIITREMGKPKEQAEGEVEFSAAIYQYYADNAVKLLADQPIDLLDGEGSAFIRRSPVGLLLGIMPWNYPYYQVARFAGPNLVTGNTILLKHAPQCPESAAAMEAIFHEAGVPTDAYINIYATNEQIEWVIGDPRVQGVSLTGSGRAGAAVAQIAGQHLKKVVLELGGSDPFIVLATDDLDAVVEQAVGGRLENTGQACNAAKRFIVVDDLYDAFVEKFTAALTEVEPGDPTSAGLGDRPAVLDRRRGPARGAGQGDARRRRHARRGRRPRRQLLQDRRHHRHHQGQPGLHRGVLRPGRAGLQGRLRGRGDRARQRHPVRPRLLRVHERQRAGAARRRPDRRRHGVHQRRRRRRRRAAVRRRQGLRLRPRARHASARTSSSTRSSSASADFSRGAAFRSDRRADMGRARG